MNNHTMPCSVSIWWNMKFIWPVISGRKKCPEDLNQMGCKHRLESYCSPTGTSWPEDREGTSKSNLGVQR